MNTFWLRRGARGFTLVEVMIALALMSLVMFGIFGFWRFFTQNMNYSFAQSNALDDAQRVSAQLVREIREMKESEIGAYPLVTAHDQEITYFADSDGDGRVEQIRYVLEGTQLKRGVIEPTGSPVTYPAGTESLRVVTANIANGVNPVFVYYNGDWPEDTVNNPLNLVNRLLQTRLLGIHLMVAVDSLEGTASAIVNKMTALRALKTN